MKTRAIQGVAVVAGLALIGTGGAFAAKSHSGPGSTSKTGVQLALANGFRTFSSGSLPAQATAMADATAAYLGLTRAELIQQVKSGKTLAQIAGEQGKSVDGLVDALIAAGTAQLDKKVADGTLTAAQRDTLVSQLRTRVTAFVNGQGAPSGFGAARADAAAMMADTAANYLGLSTDQLISQLKSGKSLAQVAVAQGKSVDGLVDALVAAGTAQLDKKVADGTLSAAQRDAIVSQLKDRITAFVNSTGSGPGFGPGPGFGTGGSPFGGSGGPPSGSPFAPGA
jgi:hypothetical protein